MNDLNHVTRCPNNDEKNQISISGWLSKREEDSNLFIARIAEMVEIYYGKNKQQS